MLAGSATSSLSVCAPSASSACKPSLVRAVAMTRSPAARYWRTNSRPMPRDAPRINTVAMRTTSDQLERQGRALAATDAQRGDAALAATGLQRVDQGDHDACAGSADGMAQRAGAAVDVD